MHRRDCWTGLVSTPCVPSSAMVAILTRLVTDALSGVLIRTVKDQPLPLTCSVPMFNRHTFGPFVCAEQLH